MAYLRFGPVLSRRRAFGVGDALILAGIAALLYAGARLAFFAPRAIAGPDISTSPRALPWYALLSVSRMAIAYTLSLGFSLVYGYAAARNASARKFLMPLLDVLQSVPILSFLPVVLLGLSAVLPQNVAAEIAAVILIFTSQAWNMTFCFYQSLSTIPAELREAAAIFRFSTLDAPPRARAAVRGDRPDLEQHDELGGRLVLPHGVGDLQGRTPRLPPSRPGLVPADRGDRRETSAP